MMSLTMWEPLRERHAFDRLVDDFFGRQANGTSRDVYRGWKPVADLVTDDSGYSFHFDVPGVAAGDIEIDVEDGVLTVSGERKSVVEEEKDASLCRREVRRGRFERAFRLPTDADPASITAEHANGVLVVRVPKAAEARARKIPVGNA